MRKGAPFTEHIELQASGRVAVEFRQVGSAREGSSWEVVVVLDRIVVDEGDVALLRAASALPPVTIQWD